MIVIPSLGFLLNRYLVIPYSVSGIAQETKHKKTEEAQRSHFFLGRQIHNISAFGESEVAVGI